MNKTQGITAGAILAAGLMLRPTATVSPTTQETGGATPASAAAGTKPTDGPWIASCKYWEPVRSIPVESAGPQATATISFTEGETHLDSKIAAPSEGESRCPVDASSQSNRWGIPTQTPGQKPEIHAIIATVPDPVHTHLSLTFDRDIDALLTAAGDNGYVPSYFWLPWKSRTASLSAEESTSREGSGTNFVRERQPGLIVFKKVVSDDVKTKSSLDSNFYSVIYLFLVAETPSLGIDGAQLNNAFDYEKELSGIRNATITYSMRTTDVVSMIGPSNSGTAASLRAGIEAAGTREGSVVNHRKVEIAGSTETLLAGSLLSKPPPDKTRTQLPPDTTIQYTSFSENAEYESAQLFNALSCAGYDLGRVAVLSEDSTVFGNQDSHSMQRTTPKKAQSLPCSSTDGQENLSTDRPLNIRFPRDISLLRNAHTKSQERQDSQDKNTPTPYLHLSLKDPGANDSVPQFSQDQMPLSQEAQLMSIMHLLQRNHTQFIVINSSNPLDQLFLAQFLHRACPEARLVFIGGDLLFGRETESVPYVGAITFSAYNLFGPTSTDTGATRGSVRAFPDAVTEAYFNAASFTFWDGLSNNIHLANFRSALKPDPSLHARLWASAIGSDGYYPLGIVSECASDRIDILPEILPSENASSRLALCGAKITTPPATTHPEKVDFFTKLWQVISFTDPAYAARQYRYPSLTWEVMCILIALLCICHAAAITFPNYWSPLTRDLAIDQGDQRHRRSMYIYIGTVMLFCMAFLTAYPVFPSFRLIHPNWHTAFYSLLVIAAAFVTLFTTFRKASPYLTPNGNIPILPPPVSRLESLRLWLNANPVYFFNLIATAALILTPLIWMHICDTETVAGNHNFVGTFFSYRCLFPGSGVSPLVPIVLIVLGWYLWSVFQALRLRFSLKNRPRLPAYVKGNFSWPLFVSDEAISSCTCSLDSCLAQNITCLLITRELLKRFFPRRRWWPTLTLIGIYMSTLCLIVFGLKFGSLDRFLWHSGKWPTCYEFLLMSIAFPLVMIALSGWLRMLLIWDSLRRGLLDPLERLPIRFAFNRLKGIGWMNMMRKGGLLEQWRDMARSTESMRQMVNDSTLMNSFDPAQKYQAKDLQEVHDELDSWISTINAVLSGAPVQAPPSPQPIAGPQAGLRCMVAIEKCYAKCCEILLGGILIPYWEKKRIGLVEGEDTAELPIKAQSLPKEESARHPHTPLQLLTSTVSEEPLHIRVAEEFLAIRYVSLIRAVLVNMRHLLMFVSVVFVLTIIAWNSYPFQPRQLIDEGFTGLLLLLGGGIIYVFAQMHRNSILSRITDTNANELGMEFYLRLAIFGAVPVLTWLAYQFPQVGGTLLRFIQPSIDVMK